MKIIFTVEVYNTNSKDEWDLFLKTTHNHTFLFYRDFMEYHHDRFEDVSLMIYKDNELFALLPGNKSLKIFHSHQGLTYGGMIYKPFSKLEDLAEALKHSLNYLHKNGFDTVWLKALPNIYKTHQDDALDYLNFKLGAKVFRKDVLSVVEPSKLKLSDSRKRGYKRAKKHNLKVVEVDDLSSFWNELLIPNLNEKYDKDPVHSLEEISNLKVLFPKNIRQFNVYDGDILVAGATVFETPEVAHVQYISGNADKNTLGSVDFLHVELIKNQFSDKKYYDFGMSHVSSGQINESLHYWKEGFGALAITQDFIEIDVKKHTLLDQVFV